MITTADLNIESQFDFTYVYNQLSPKSFIEKKFEGNHSNYLKNVNELKYQNLENNYLSFYYPIHKTIQDELEKEGLKVINFTREDIDDLISYEFEVNSNGYNVAEIEYNILKKLDLISKGITITVY